MSTVTGGEQLVYDLRDLMRLLKVGKTTIQEKTYSGELPSIKIGSRRVWPVDGVKRWLAAQTVYWNPGMVVDWGPRSQKDAQCK